ncbi:MAG TPA: SRPBCC family protein [Polyangia bacterium]|jgi:hypothetical protein
MKHVLERRQLVGRPRSEVFAFFADPANLERLTPGSLHFRILTPLPIEMRAGAIIDYQLVLHGLRFGWRTVIESHEPQVGFVDVQTKGPYRSWRHVHRFADADRGTMIEDRIEYEMPLGPLGALARALFVKRQLRDIFDFRRETVARLFA